MAEGPALSIVVPALNEAACIEATLLGLQCLRTRDSQNTALAEVIVVDGGSTDDTLALAAPLADRVVRGARGRAAQMNAGAAFARGAMLLFLHADTRLDAVSARRIIHIYHASDERWLWGRYDVRLDGATGVLRLTQWLINLRSRWSGIATGDQAMFASRHAFDAVGGFPAIALMEDVELSKRLRRHARPVCLRETVTTSARRWREHGVLRTVGLMWFLRSAYALGASPAWLKQRYANHQAGKASRRSGDSAGASASEQSNQ